MDKKIFRMYDIRGIVPDDLNEEKIVLIGKAFGTLLRRADKTDITVGMDARLTSPELKSAIIEGIVSTGLDVIDIGLVPTPVLYFSVYHYNIGGGVMITGSHNPVEYNGVKLMKGKHTLYGEEIQKIREIIENKSFLSGKGSVKTKDVYPDYMEKVLSIIYPEKRLRVVIDPGNGVAGDIAVKSFQRLGAEVKCINCKPDGTFPAHLPDPTIPEFMEELRKTVVSENFAFGVGYDGDGDRIGVIDDRGNIIWGDKLLALFSEYTVQRFHKAKIIFDVKCSRGLQEFIQKVGGTPIMWKTGHSLIKAKMQETGAILAGEMSGHIFCGGDYYGYDDAVFASLRLYEIISKSQSSLSKLISRVPQYFATPEIRIDTTEKDKWRITEEVKVHFRKKYKTVEIDGVRIELDDGWGLVRASNTQPVIVVRFEAKTKERLEEIKKEVMDFIEEKK